MKPFASHQIIRISDNKNSAMSKCLYTKMNRVPVFLPGDTAIAQTAAKNYYSKCIRPDCAGNRVSVINIININ